LDQYQISFISNKKQLKTKTTIQIGDYYKITSNHLKVEASTNYSSISNELFIFEPLITLNNKKVNRQNNNDLSKVDFEFINNLFKSDIEQFDNINYHFKYNDNRSIINTDYNQYLEYSIKKKPQFGRFQFKNNKNDFIDINKFTQKDINEGSCLSMSLN
jgi:hypothetical protein